IDPTPISYAPFTSPTLFENSYIKAAEIGLSLGDGAVCMFAPCFASYVGGDITAGLVSTGLCRAEDTSLFLDIGTNGETALVCRGKIYLCSTAAGPAFEGAGIECGTAGISGAIASVSYDGKIDFTTIDGKAPAGICGSGIIDALAVMLDTGVLDESGAILGDKFDICENVYISGKDVRKVQLAKAAVCAGILTLMKEANVGKDDVDRVILAGGFGSHINAENAAKIGLIPKELAKKAIFAGNTAGSGAVALLLSNEARLAAGEAVRDSIYTELSVNKYFMDEYIEQMSF
ncbi:MAG: DUF4445 domain-containing protein, partial [Clostridiales bacterium]|nr:DUF4445 domain-containing protein [Clostridiales bacterium]